METEELRFMRELEQDVQRLRGYANSTRLYNTRSSAESTYNLIILVKSKINRRIVELLEGE